MTMHRATRRDLIARLRLLSQQCTDIGTLVEAGRPATEMVARLMLVEAEVERVEELLAAQALRSHGPLRRFCTRLTQAVDAAREGTTRP